MPGLGWVAGAERCQQGQGRCSPLPRVLPPHPSRELAGRGGGEAPPVTPKLTHKPLVPKKRGRNPTLGPCCFLPILLQRFPPSPRGLGGGAEIWGGWGGFAPFPPQLFCCFKPPSLPSLVPFFPPHFFPPLCFDFLSVQEDIKNKPRHGPSLGVLFAHGLLILILFGRVWAFSGFPA